MGADDLQLRKIGGDFVQINRLAVFQFNAHAARRAGSRRRHAAVKQNRHVELGAFFPKRIKANVVGKKVLPRRIELAHPVQTEIFTATNFIQCELAGPGIDGAEG